MKADLKKKVMLAVLAMVYGGVYMPCAGTASAAFNLALTAQTDATGKTYKTNGIGGVTTVSQATKDGDITLGQTINFGNYAQSIATGSLTVRETGANNDVRYKENGTVTYNTENVSWIVVKNNGSDIYTLVSTKILDQHIFDSTSQKWSGSSMRTWMNDYMLNTMLTTREQALLQSQNTTTYGYTSGSTGQNGWDDSTSTDTAKGYNTATEDKMWLLSVQELHEYFKNTLDTNPNTSNYPGGYYCQRKSALGCGCNGLCQIKRDMD